MKRYPESNELNFSIKFCRFESQFQYL